MEESSYSFCHIQWECISTEKSKWLEVRVVMLLHRTACLDQRRTSPTAQLSLWSPGEAQGVLTAPQYAGCTYSTLL